MLLLIAATPHQAQPDASPSRPFASLEPAIRISDDERRRLDAREVVIKVLPADRRELAMFAAGSLTVGADRLIAKINDIAALKRSRNVPEIGRFSAVPTLQDLSTLTLDDVDLEAISDCRPGDCGLKLSGREIDQLRRATGSSSGKPSAHAATEQFRRIVLDRVEAYLAKGLSGIPTYDTGRRQADLPLVFSELLEHDPFLVMKEPRLARFLGSYPAEQIDSGVESFLYWSKETYAWKPIISVTHMTIIRPERNGAAREMIAVAREVFATRYTSGGLVLTMLLKGPEADAPHYLVYVNRTSVDGMRAFWRPFVERRLRREGAKVFSEARARIEH
jgi:hypothetical protein